MVKCLYDKGQVRARLLSQSYEPLVCKVTEFHCILTNPIFFTYTVLEINNH